MAFTPKKKAGKGKSSGKFEPQPNSIRMFKNESDNEKAPNFTGQLTLGEEVLEAILEGQTELRVALWKVQSDKGTRFLAGQVTLPYEANEDGEEEDEEKPVRSKKPSKKPAKGDDWDDEDGEENEY